jgi:hypothetical protein
VRDTEKRKKTGKNPSSSKSTSGYVFNQGTTSAGRREEGGHSTIGDDARDASPSLR